MRGESHELTIYSTCPPSNRYEPAEYSAVVRDVARWSERHGCEGILVYTDNGLLDPWLVSGLVMDATEHLAPLIAVQPIYMHPYTAAKMAATIAALRGRRVDFNLLAGGFKNDLVALGDETPHDDRYRRTTEYALIVRGLCSGEAVTFHGSYYSVKGLKLTPPVPEELRPRFLISGSSSSGLQAARDIDATAVCYPEPAANYDPFDDATPRGIRVGLLARLDADEAWRVADARFPSDRRGQLTHQLAMKTSDSSWHRQLSVIGKELGDAPRQPYWLHPFENYKTFCPYLVGDYDTVAEYVASYLRAGFRTLILDVPRAEEDLVHTHEVVRRALDSV